MERIRRFNPFRKSAPKVETSVVMTDVSDRFLTENLDLFQNLSPQQCKFILRTIEAELEISKGFRLEINAAERLEEKMVFLTVFNRRIKDIQQWKDIRGQEYLYVYEIAQSQLLAEVSYLLTDISKKYFDIFSKMETLEVKNKYTIHLEMTLATIFRGFWNDKFVT